MFKLIKYIIVMGLMVGVVFLGLKIHKKSLQMETSLADQKTQAKEKIAALEKSAVKETLELGKVYKEINDSLDGVKVKQDKIQAKKDTKVEPAPSFPATGTGTREPAVSLKPIDDEDRKVTSEILAEVSNKKQAPADDKAQLEFPSETLISENVVSELEPVEPLDIKRVTEIRDVYSKAIEALDLK
jgi:hypothetical protein